MQIKQDQMKEMDGIISETDNEEKCDCIFCNSKCLACESDDVNVIFRPSYSYSNDTDDFIDITYDEAEVELTCNECGKYFLDDELGELTTSLEKYLNVANYGFEWNGKGKPIKQTSYRMVTQYSPSL